MADIYVFGSRKIEITARVHDRSKDLPAHSASDVDIAVSPVDISQFEPLQRVSLAIDLEDLFDAPHRRL